jgi:hypothetical protein
VPVSVFKAKHLKERSYSEQAYRAQTTQQRVILTTNLPLERVEKDTLWSMIRRFAPVAQLDRVPDYESGGRTFESCRARQHREPHPPDGAFLWDFGRHVVRYLFPLTGIEALRQPQYLNDVVILRTFRWDLYLVHCSVIGNKVILNGLLSTRRINTECHQRNEVDGHHGPVKR